MILEELTQFLNLPMSVILIHQILEELKQTNEKDCCRICENLLEKLTSQKDCLFVVTYMIEHLTGVLTEERVDVLHQTQIGCEVSSCQHTYPHPPSPSSSIYIPVSGNLSVITFIYWYTCMYQCTYSTFYSRLSIIFCL